MPNPHTIRLNGPWEMIAPPADEPVRVKLPGDWPVVAAACAAGPVVLQRWFHRPTGLDEQTAVQLITSTLPCSGSVSLNDVRLGDITAGQTHHFNVGPHLSPRGCLTLSLEATSGLEAIKPASPEATTAPAPIPEIALTILPRS